MATSLLFNKPFRVLSQFSPATGKVKEKDGEMWLALTKIEKVEG